MERLEQNMSTNVSVVLKTRFVIKMVVLYIFTANKSERADRLLHCCMAIWLVF